MVRKVQKTLSLPIDVVEELENESNQSRTVEDALRERYGMCDDGK